MKTKILTLLLAVAATVILLSGCIQSDIGIKLNKDETGSIGVMIGIEKSFYEQLAAMEDNVFDGKETTEYESNGKTYIAYTVTKEYDSYEEIEQALLALTYDTDNFDTMTDEQPVEAELPQAYVFKSVEIEKNSGIFYTSYSFKASLNLQSVENDGYCVNDIFDMTISIEMPSKITQCKGGTIDGNKAVYHISDLTAETELAVDSDSNNVVLVVGIVVLLLTFAAISFCLVKRKK